MARQNIFSRIASAARRIFTGTPAAPATPIPEPPKTKRQQRAERRAAKKAERKERRIAKREARQKDREERRGGDIGIGAPPKGEEMSVEGAKVILDNFRRKINTLPLPERGGEGMSAHETPGKVVLDMWLNYLIGTMGEVKAAQIIAAMESDTEVEYKLQYEDEANGWISAAMAKAIDEIGTSYNMKDEIYKGLQEDLQYAKEHAESFQDWGNYDEF